MILSLLLLIKFAFLSKSCLYIFLVLTFPFCRVQSFTDLSKQLFKNQDSVQQIKHNHVEARNHLDTLYNKTLNSLRDIGDPKSDDALRSFV